MQGNGIDIQELTERSPPTLLEHLEQGLELGWHCLYSMRSYGAGHQWSRPSRRLAMLGFCRSVSDLSEVVEDAVLSCGGKIVLNQIELKRCRHLTALHCL